MKQARYKEPLPLAAVYSPSRWRDMGLTRSPANYPQTGLKFLSYTLPASTRV